MRRHRIEPRHLRRSPHAGHNSFLSVAESRAIAELREQWAAEIAELGPPPPRKRWTCKHADGSVRHELVDVDFEHGDAFVYRAAPLWMVVDVRSGSSFGSGFMNRRLARSLALALSRVGYHFARAANGDALAATAISRIVRAYRTIETRLAARRGKRGA